jgi:ankyrin repeat protein
MFHARAHELLAQHPVLAGTSIWAAAAAGNAAAVQSFLDQDATLANRPGPHGWAPLICACYSRVPSIDPGHSTHDVARLLLDRGADPNASTLKRNDPPGSGRARRFTALTGVFGGGSTGLANQPPHPRWRELAELLLQRGANPADEQALWINQGASLELLLRYGLKPDAKVQTESGAITLLGRELSQAARRNRVDAVKLLLAHGARVDEAFEGKTPWQVAIEKGNLEIARLLEQAGAPVSELDPVERFTSLCVACDEPGARAMLERDPDLLRRAPKDLVLRAQRGGRTQAVRLALELGFDPNAMDDNAAIHGAGGSGDEAMARVLLQGGASLTLREPWYDGTGVGWADFFDQRALRDLLLSEGPICLFDALQYDRLDRLPDILTRDPEALNLPFARCISREPKPEDWQTPLVRAVNGGAIDAVRVLLEHGADITARHPDGRSLLQLAREKGFTEIAELLQRHGAI